MSRSTTGSVRSTKSRSRNNSRANDDNKQRSLLAFCACTTPSKVATENLGDDARGPSVVTTHSPPFVSLPGLEDITLTKTRKKTLLLENVRKSWRRSVAHRLWVGMVIRQEQTKQQPLLALPTDREFAKHRDMHQARTNNQVVYELEETPLRETNAQDIPLSPQDALFVTQIQEGRLSDALRLLDAMLESDVAKEHPLIHSAYLYNKAMLSLILSRDHRNILHYFHESLEQKSPYLPRDHPAILDTMEQIAIALYCCHQFERSLKFYQVIKTLQGDGVTPESLRVWNGIGCGHFRMARVTFALHCLKRAATATTTAPSSDEWSKCTAIAMANLGHAQISKGKRKEGRASLEAAQPVLARLLGRQDEIVTSIESQLEDLEYSL